MSISVFRQGEIIDHDIDGQIERITSGVTGVFIPKDAEFITHYWLFFKNHQKCAYFGTPESFQEWQRENVN